jgi:hypothetical protein
LGKEFEVSVPHHLSQEDAMKRIKSLVNELKTRFGGQVSDVHEEWTENSCKFSMKLKMFRLAGSIVVEPKVVVIKGTMPTGTGRYENKAKTLIQDQAQKLLS